MATIHKNVTAKIFVGCLNGFITVSHVSNSTNLPRNIIANIDTLIIITIKITKGVIE